MTAPGKVYLRQKASARGELNTARSFIPRPAHFRLGSYRRVRFALASRTVPCFVFTLPRFRCLEAVVPRLVERDSNLKDGLR
jgi:hypothetical protein